MKGIKYVIGTILISTILFGISACQATPKEKAVVDKSQGLPKDAVIDTIKEGEEKKIDAPSHWTEEKNKESKDGTITMKVDVDIDVPKISNTPVWEFEQKKLSEKGLDKLIKYFCGDAKLYEVPKMTKAELEVHKKRIENGQGLYKVWTRTDKSNMIERINERIERAPTLEEKKNDASLKFGKYTQGEITYVIRGAEKKFDTDKDAYFNAKVDKGELDPSISAKTFDKNAGTSSEFQYQRGAIYTEKDLEKDQELVDANMGIAELPAYIERMNKELTKNDIAEEVALKKVNEVCKDLELQDFQMVNKVKGLWIPQESDTGLNIKVDYIWSASPEDFKTGYMFTYTRAVEGLSASRSLDGAYYTGLPGTQYFPPFVQEEVTIFVTEEGVQYFSWEGMAKKSGIIADNTKLLSFEKIKEELMNQIVYRNTAPPGQQGDTTIGEVVCNVNSAELQLAYSQAYKNPERAWLVPTWVFMVEKENTDIKEPIRINAIDGGNIQNATAAVLEQ